MKIIGIDPGSRLLGFGVIHSQNGNMKAMEYGVLKFDVDENLSERLLEIGDEVGQLFDSYKPDQVAIEKIFLGKNADSAFKLGHVRGIVIYQALKRNIKVYEYATRLVKKGVTGTGSAEKEHVRAVVQKLLNIPPIKSLDASDALALACYHASQMRVHQMRVKDL